MTYPYAPLDVVGQADFNKTMFSFQSERFVSFTVGARLAQGNGATTNVAAVSVNCRLVYATLRMAPGAVGTHTVGFAINGSLTGTTMSKTGPGNFVLNLTTGTPVLLSANDRFWWEITALGSTSDTIDVVSFFRQV